MTADGLELRERSRPRAPAPPTLGARTRRVAASGLVAGAIALWVLVWAGAVAALYQAAVVLAGLVCVLGAVQLLVRGRAKLVAAKAVGAVLGVALVAEVGAIMIDVSGIGAPPIFRYRDGDRTMTRDSRLLGYRADVDDGAVRAVKRRPDGALLYDVTYTLRDGLRATRGDASGPCTVVFMIDSFVFGDGLADADTLPQRFSEATGFRLNVVNLGFPGYGPQQMLAWLEDKSLDRFVRSPLAAAYYTSIDDHVLRVAGLTEWTRFDPRYALVDGALTRTGRFHGPPSLASFGQFKRDLPGFLGASHVYHRALRPLLLDVPGRIPAARALYVEALSRADALLKARYGVPLTILVWHAEERSRPALAELARRGLAIVWFDSLIGPITDAYRIADGHPSALANRRAGAALAQRFAGCPPR